MEAAIKGIPVLTIIRGLSEYHGKKYCYPSQKKILELLKNRIGIKISIATLNRYLRVVEDRGWVKRIRRIRRDPIKGMIFQSTLYIILKKGYRLMRSTGINIWFFKKRVFRPKEEKKLAPGKIVYNGGTKRFKYEKNPE